MTALKKLAVAAVVVGAAGPTTAMAITEYESHHGAVVLSAALFAGAALLVALSAADEHAAEVGRLKAQASTAHTADADAPPSARTPLFEQPASAAHDAGYAEGAAAGYHQGWGEGYRAGYRNALVPSTGRASGRHAAETTAVDLTPIDDTVVMAAITEETAEQLATRASDEAEAAGDGFEGFFTAASARQAASAA